MPLLKWSSEYAIYIPEIDAEHRALFRMADGLHRAVMAGADPARVQLLLRALVSHVTSHFSHEERLMRSVKCPSYVWHKRQHDAACAKLRCLARRIRRGDREAALLLLHFLSGWLNDHTRLTDRMMGASLRNYDRAQAAIAS